MQTLDKEFIDFLCTEIGVKPDKIKEHSSVSKDFGVAGDDGLDLLVAYSEKYSVDISDFPVYEYFGEEISLFPGIFYYLYLKCSGKWTELKSLLVSDLIEGINTGKLIDKFAEKDI